MKNKIPQEVERAIKCGSFHRAEVGGKLTSFAPQKGDIVVYEFLDKTSTILKDPDSMGNTLVDKNGKTFRENIKSGGIAGYIRWLGTSN